MHEQIINTSLLRQLNPEYAEAIARGEPWAIKHSMQVDSINRKEPEGMRREFDGKPRKWCGSSCGHEEGCVVCTLPENGQVAREHRKHLKRK
jgi:hypothetical protein